MKNAYKYYIMNKNQLFEENPSIENTELISAHRHSFEENG